MLILTRRASQAFMIGEDITVTVLAIHGHQVRLGVTAPANVEVHREEIYRRIYGNRKRTGGGNPPGSQAN